MPWRAMSIIPLLMAAPMNTPIDAIKITCLNGATLVPNDEFKKFTASLLTPTVRSKIASKKRKAMMAKNKKSIL